MEKTLVRCDDCNTEFELFSDLLKATTCLHGRPHRAVRICQDRPAVTSASPSPPEA